MEDADWWPLEFELLGGDWHRAKLTINNTPLRVYMWTSTNTYSVARDSTMAMLKKSLDILELRCYLIELSRNPP